jgi:hypothetical protein
MVPVNVKLSPIVTADPGFEPSIIETCCALIFHVYTKSAVHKHATLNNERGVIRTRSDALGLNCLLWCTWCSLCFSAKEKSLVISFDHLLWFILFLSCITDTVYFIDTDLLFLFYFVLNCDFNNWHNSFIVLFFPSVPPEWVANNWELNIACERKQLTINNE